MARINIMSSTKSITVVLILFSLLVPLFPGIAVAAGRPALTWNFSDSQVTSDTPLLASFVFNGLPTGSIVTFERGFGTRVFYALLQDTPLRELGPCKLLCLRSH